MGALDYINNVFKHPTSKEERIEQIIDYCERLMEQKNNYYYARGAELRSSGDANDIQRADELQGVINQKVNNLRTFIQNESSFLRGLLYVDGNSHIIRSRNLGIAIDNYDKYIERIINNVVVYGGNANDVVLESDIPVFNNNRVNIEAIRKNNERRNIIRSIQYVETSSRGMNSHMTQSYGQRTRSNLREVTTIDLDVTNENTGQRRGDNAVNTGNEETNVYLENGEVRRPVDSVKGKSPTGFSRTM